MVASSGVVLLLASLCCLFLAAGSDSTCTYVGYGNFYSANKRTLQTLIVGQNLLVEVHSYSLGALRFQKNDTSTPCDFSNSDPNGWNVAQLGGSSDPCEMNVTKLFDLGEYEARCGTASVTETGDSLLTVVIDTSVDLWTGVLPDKEDYYTAVNAEFQTTTLIPTRANSSVIGYIVTPMALGAAVYGTSGVSGTTIIANVLIQVTPPYCVTAVEPKPEAIPSSQYAATVLTTEIECIPHSYSSAFVLLTSIPKGDCYCFGNFTIKFYLSCNNSDSSCDSDMLKDNPFFLSDILVAVPSCAMEYQYSSAALSIITYNENGAVDLSFMSGESVRVREQISVEGGQVPGGNCSCVTNLLAYDWAGSLLNNFSDVQHDSRFSPVNVSLGPLLNEFWITFASSLFKSPNGVVISLVGICKLEWRDQDTLGKENLRMGDSEMPSSAQGLMSLSLSTPDTGINWAIAAPSIAGTILLTVLFTLLAVYTYRRCRTNANGYVQLPPENPGARPFIHPDPKQPTLIIYGPS
ncbi:hypothetical protein Pelo_12870 [Pelomyxa schiedti]|nr:hypothetical protein Pelo_12870 [Pelomyxa schiedti]